MRDGTNKSDIKQSVKPKFCSHVFGEGGPWAPLEKKTKFSVSKLHQEVKS